LKSQISSDSILFGGTNRLLRDRPVSHWMLCAVCCPSTALQALYGLRFCTAHVAEAVVLRSGTAVSSRSGAASSARGRRIGSSIVPAVEARATAFATSGAG